jgi:hypothetical protein
MSTFRRTNYVRLHKKYEWEVVLVHIVKGLLRSRDTALHYLCPHDDYRGDPAKLLAERKTKLRQPAGMRREYWEEHRH